MLIKLCLFRYNQQNGDINFYFALTYFAFNFKLNDYFYFIVTKVAMTIIQ